MTRFRYQATDDSGQTVAGELAAESVENARQELAHRGWQVIELLAIDPAVIELSESDKVVGWDSVPTASGQTEPGQTGPGQTGSGQSPNLLVSSVGRLGGDDATLLAGQMANVAGAGLPLADGLRALSEEVPSQRVRRWLTAISDRLARGQSLSSVAREAEASWPRYFLAMLDAGQRTGRLPEMLNECVWHLRTIADVRRQLLAALAYPMVLILVAWLLLSFLATVIIPQMRAIFLGFGTELPGITTAILAVSEVLEYLGWWFLPVTILAVWGAWHACDALDLERQRDWLVSRIPLYGEARRSAGLGEFCRLLSLLVRYRIPLPEAIRLAAGSVRDADLREACSDLAMRVDGGQSLSDAASATGRFTRDLLHLFRWADRGDDFAEGLLTASDVLSAQSRIHSHTLAVVCEPAVTVMIGGMVGFTVIALFMPLIRLLNDLS